MNSWCASWLTCLLPGNAFTSRQIRVCCTPPPPRPAYRLHDGASEGGKDTLLAWRAAWQCQCKRGGGVRPGVCQAQFVHEELVGLAPGLPCYNIAVLHAVAGASSVSIPPIATRSAWPWCGLIRVSKRLELDIDLVPLSTEIHQDNLSHAIVQEGTKIVAGRVTVSVSQSAAFSQGKVSSKSVGRGTLLGHEALASGLHKLPNRNREVAYNKRSDTYVSTPMYRLVGSTFWDHLRTASLAKHEPPPRPSQAERMNRRALPSDQALPHVSRGTLAPRPGPPNTISTLKPT